MHFLTSRELEELTDPPSTLNLDISEPSDFDASAYLIYDKEAYCSFDAASLAGTDETRGAEVDLYDSGATQHMSGF